MARELGNGLGRPECVCMRAALACGVACGECGECGERTVGGEHEVYAAEVCGIEVRGIEVCGVRGGRGGGSARCLTHSGAAPVSTPGCVLARGSAR